MSACSPSGLPSKATKTAGQSSTPASWTKCGSVAPITGIVYATGKATTAAQVEDYGGNDWYSDGKLQISIPEVSFTDAQSLLTLASTMASALNSSSMNWANYKTTVGPYCDNWAGESECNNADFWSGPNCVNYTANGPYGESIEPVKAYPPDVASIPGYIQTIITIDTGTAPDWPVQFMSISLAAELPEAEAAEGPFKCGDGALITDGLGVLPMLEALSFLDWLAIPALVVSAICAAEENSAPA